MPTQPTTPPTVGAITVVPNRATDGDQFSNNTDTMLGDLADLQTEQNGLADWEKDTGDITYANAVESANSATSSASSSASSASSALIATGAANYQGLWSTLTGAYAKGISVKHNDLFWLLNDDVTDITVVEPSVSSDWDQLHISPNLSALDNPIFHGFKKNKLCETGFPTADTAITWTRGSPKTGIRNGRMVTFAVDEPAMVDGGFEFSPQSTNIALWSEDFTNSVWGKIGSVTITSDDSTAPDGTLTADLVDTATIGDNRFFQGVTTSDPIGLSYTASVWLKGSGDVVLRLSNFNNGDRVDKIITLTNSWVRYSATRAFTASSTGVRFTLSHQSAPSQYHAWGAQVELDTLTPYIATTTTPVTRLTDVIAINGENHPRIETGTPLSIAMNVDTKGVVPTAADEIINAVNADYSLLRVLPDGSKVYFRDLNATSFGDILNTKTLITVSDLDHVSLYEDGQYSYSESSSATGGQATQINIGESLNFIINDLRIYDFELNPYQAYELHGE